MGLTASISKDPASIIRKGESGFGASGGGSGDDDDDDDDNHDENGDNDATTGPDHKGSGPGKRSPSAIRQRCAMIPSCLT